MHDREILTLYVNRDPRDVAECLNDLWLMGSSRRFLPWEMLKRYNE